MKKFMLQTVNAAFLLMTLSLTAFSADVFAAGAESETGWKLIPKFMYMISNTTTNGNASNQNRFLADGAFGYRFTSPFFVGALYGYDNTSSNSNTSQTNSGVGPTVGYMADNFYFLITYYVYATQVNTTGPANVTFSNGNGFQVDLSYLFDVGSSWSLGPVMSYRSLHYGTVSPGGSIDYTYTTLLPYVGVVIAF